jgi:hypothetical protein
MGRHHYTSKYVVHKLVMYYIILGKNWMEDVSHHDNQQQNIIWLAQTASSGRLKYYIDR